ARSNSSNSPCCANAQRTRVARRMLKQVWAALFKSKSALVVAFGTGVLASRSALSPQQQQPARRGRTYIHDDDVDNAIEPNRCAARARHDGELADHNARSLRARRARDDAPVAEPHTRRASTLSRDVDRSDLNRRAGAQFQHTRADVAHAP